MIFSIYISRLVYSVVRLEGSLSYFYFWGKTSECLQTLGSNNFFYIKSLYDKQEDYSLPVKHFQFS